MKHLFATLILLISTPLFSYQKLPDEAKTPILTPHYQEIKKEKLRLDNGLEVYLISNPKAKQSGAILSVQTGSWDDPEETPGMAHFLEHMLFLGTKSHPDEAEFSAFISQNGGMTNAFTANTQTSYLFTVNSNAMEEATKRFSEFFYEPLFNPSGIERELLAIDQEFEKDRDNDQMRLYYIQKALSRNKHPHSRFHVGNRETLKNISRTEMLNWYETHYSADNMRLIALSPLPLETVRELVIENFGKIENRNLPKKRDASNTLPKNVLGHYIYFTPVKERRTLNITWELPENLASQKGARAADTISYILGHEGEKSLLAQLKRENLAEKLTSGTLSLGNHTVQFALEVELTDQGARDPKRVISRIFSAITPLKKNALPEQTFQNIRQLIALNYQYPAPQQEFETLMKYGLLIFQEALTTFPEKSLLLDSYDPAYLQQVAGSLTPNKALITLMLPEKLHTEKLNYKEPWLNTPYTLTPIPPKDLIAWNEEPKHPNIGLPKKNPFLPKDFAVITHGKKELTTVLPEPELLKETEQLKIYFAKDTIYGTPKVSYHFQIKSPHLQSKDPQKVALTDLFIKGVKERLNTLSYPAKMAGYQFDIVRDSHAIEISVQGFSDKADRLLKEIFQELIAFAPDEESYQSLKESLLRKYRKKEQDSSFYRAIENLKKVIYKDYSTEAEKRAQLRKTNFETYQAFQESLFHQLYLKGVIYGNIKPTEALNITEELLKNFNATPYPPSEHLDTEVVIFPEKDGPYYYPSKSNTLGNAALLAIENPHFSYEKKAAQAILMQAIKQPFFDELRTKQQTAYLVFSQPQEIKKKLFDFFAVQSNSHDPRDLLSRFELFLESYLQEMGKSTLREPEFNTIKASLLHLLKKPPENLGEMGQTLSKLAFDFDEEFDRVEKKIEAIDALTYDRFQELAKQMIGKDNKRRLGILIKGQIEGTPPFNYNKIRHLSSYLNLCEYNRN